MKSVMANNMEENDKLVRAIKEAIVNGQSDDPEVCETISRNLRHPEQTPAGRFIGTALIKRNTPVERLAATLSKIESHQHVLEVGFGPGIGLKAAYPYIKDGSGRLHGVDISEQMLDLARENLQEELASGKVHLHLGSVTNLPFDANTFDQVFHTNCYYFWDDMDQAVNEIKRVMKPGTLLVCCFNKERIEKVNHTPFMQFGDTDVHRYMDSLERCGFTDIRMEAHYIDDSPPLHSIQAKARK